MTENDTSPSGFVVKPKPGSKTARVRERDQSTIAFPYLDLETGISIARAIHARGAVPLTREQLAAAMGQASASGAFLTKVATARLFTLIESAQFKYQLTDLGHRIVSADEAQVKAARAQAFLSVPLFRKTYEEFRGRALPPRPHGIEAAFVQFGVAPKQKDRARLAFEKSAQQAGFFAHGQDRLVEPVLTIAAQPPKESKPQQATEQSPEREPQPHARSLHPFIQGLITELPEPGTVWKEADRKKWMRFAELAFDLLYEDEAEPSGRTNPAS